MLDRRSRVDGPGMEQVEVARQRLAERQVVGVGQAGGRVFGGEARDVVGGAHRLLERRAREIGGARVAAALADVDRDADRLVAVALDVFDLALAHRDRQPGAFRHLDAGIARAELLREMQARLRRAAGTARAIREAGIDVARWKRLGDGHWWGAAATDVVRPMITSPFETTRRNAIHDPRAGSQSRHRRASGRARPSSRKRCTSCSTSARRSPSCPTSACASCRCPKRCSTPSLEFQAHPLARGTAAPDAVHRQADAQRRPRAAARGRGCDAAWAARTTRWRCTKPSAGATELIAERRARSRAGSPSIRDSDLQQLRSLMRAARRDSPPARLRRRQRPARPRLSRAVPVHQATS